MLVGSAAWWWAVLGGFLQPAAAATWHGLTMTLGFLPLFFAGFLQTTLPRWLRLAPCEVHSPVAEQRAVLGLMVGGWLLSLGLASAWPAAAGAGLLPVLLGWTVWLRRWWRARGRSTETDRWHASAILSVASGLAVLMLALALVLLRGQVALVPAGLRLGWWALLLPVFLIASHRWLPFFAGAHDAAWPLPLLWGVCALHGLWNALQLAGGPAWPLLGALHSAAMLLGAGVAAWLAWRWWRLRRLGNPLVRLLFLTWCWVPLALGLAAWPGAELLALHASAAGFAAGTWLLMISRLSAGLAGQAQAVDRVLGRLWALQQGAAVLRLLSGWPLLAGFSGGLQWWSASLWLGWCLGWFWRQSRVWWVPCAASKD